MYQKDDFFSTDYLESFKRFRAVEKKLIICTFIDKITIVKHGAVRRARIFYFRERTGKSARIREKIIAADKK
jgi:ribosomal protein L19